MSLAVNALYTTVLGAAAACTTDISTDDPRPGDQGAAPSWEQFEREATRVIDGRTVYVVEWDLALSHAELRAYYDEMVAGEAGGTARSTVNRVGNADDVWPAGQQLGLTYCVSNDFGADKARAVAEMATATAEWEAVANVDFTYLPQHDSHCDNGNSNVRFSVRPQSSGGACAFFPSGGGCVERTLVINLAAFPSPSAPNATSVGVFRHELGHILGLRHEHIRATTCSEDTSWRALTMYDVDSVMHYPWCNGVTTSHLWITPLDAAGVRALYGVHDGRAWHTWQGSPGGGFGGWQPRGERRGFAKAVAEQNADGRLELFAVDAATGMVRHTWQTTPSGDWTGWYRLGDAVGLYQLTAAKNADGRLELFGLDSASGLVWHTWQVTPGGGWSGWARLGDAAGVGRLTVGKNADGRLELFAVDTTKGTVTHAWQTSPSGGWTGWYRLGDAVGLGPIAVGKNADGRLEVFAASIESGLVWHAWQTSPSGGWTGWYRLGDAVGVGQIAVGKNADGRLEVFAVDTAARLSWHTWQTTPSGGWTGWYRLGDAVGLGSIAVATNADGRLELFAVDTAAGLSWHTAQTSAGGAWAGWSRLFDIAGVGELAVATNADGRLELFGISR
jgi:hypothetical protein